MTDKNIAIRVRNLGKRYILGGSQEKYHTLRDAIVNSVKAPFNRASSLKRSGRLKDVSFDVEQSEVVGIIGQWCQDIDVFFGFSQGISLLYLGG
ncbi:MAG: hypothetical protein Q7V05_11285 [Methanoregula sp.]|nr:hypothetical protein [Methanoregula sp.]